MQDVTETRTDYRNQAGLSLSPCGWCVGTLTDILSALDRSARIEADLEVRTLRVRSNYYEAALLRILRETGYPAEPILPPLG